MTTRLLHALEVSDSSATLYLSGHLAGHDAFPLRGVCRDIPVHVRTLRLDLHGVTTLEEGAMDAIRALVRYWRETRNGNFRLAFACEHDVVSVVEPELAPPATGRVEVGGRVGHHLAARLTSPSRLSNCLTIAGGSGA